MALKKCKECGGAGEAYCGDCSDLHRCDICGGAGLISSGKIYCDFEGSRMEVITGSEAFLWLKSEKAGPFANWDRCALRTDCSNFGEA